jgi:hypothetical protein
MMRQRTPSCQVCVDRTLSVVIHLAESVVACSWIHNRPGFVEAGAPSAWRDSALTSANCVRYL